MLANVVPITPPDSAPEPTFDDFWTLYPKRVARKEARKAWNRINANDHVAALVALIGWRREWLKRGELQYTPHPASWLNGERWTDELPEPTNGSAVLDTFKPLPAKDRRAIPPEVLAELQRLRGKL